MVNRIKEIRKLRGWTQEALAENLGTYKSKISKLENGELRLTDVWITKLAKAFGCSPADLLADFGSDISQNNKEISVPVIGEVSGGDLLIAIQEPPIACIPYHTKKSYLCALRVNGNSMSRIAAHGAYVVVDTSQKDPTILLNQPVIVQIHNGFEWECSFKIYKNNPIRFEPYSLEPTFETIFPAERHWNIFGRVVGVYGILGDNAELIEK